jgi:predicted dehydrogenase
VAGGDEFDVTGSFRWGIAGTGRIAHDFTLALRDVPEATVAAVASRTQPRADEFGDTHEIRGRHASYQALAEDPGVDIVYVATPHSRHESDALLFLEAGKHVLCEKPFALNERQARRMADTARRRRVFLMEALWSRFLPAYGTIRSLIEGGRIGEPRFVDGEFGFRVPMVDPEHRLFNPALGGGSLLDLGVYPLHLATMVLGLPASVTAKATLGSTGVDETVVATLGYDGGALAVITSSLALHLRGGARIIGTEGSITIAPPMHRPDRLTVVSGMDSENVDCPLDGAGLAAQAREVHRCLEAGVIESSILPLDETCGVMAVLDAIRTQIGVAYPTESVSAHS